MPGEQEKLYKAVIAYFQENMPVAETELHYSNAYELIVAVMLSAQCTDKRVNLITPAFFQRFPTLSSLSQTTADEVFSHIRTCSYPNNKAKHLVAMAQKVMAEFDGEIPHEVSSLETLPGVGRKSANVVASVVFNKPAMAVDTHVFRVSARLGLTVNARTPLEAERQLTAHIPEELISKAHHWLILHGRYVCLARKPRCADCGLRPLCAWYALNDVG